MALQWRLTIWFGSLIVILILAHWWLMRSLGQSVLVESAYFAADVSHEILFEVEEGSMIRELVGQEPKSNSDSPSELREFQGKALEKPDGDTKVFIKHVEMRNADKPNMDLHIIQQTLEGDDARVWVDQNPESPHLMLKRPDGKVKRIDLPAARIRSRVEEANSKLIAATSLLLLVGLLVTWVIARKTASPLKALVRAADQVGQGHFGYQVSASGGTAEMQSALNAFNRMSARLQELEIESQKLRRQESLHELAEIGRGMAHAIRNPLNAVGLAVDEMATDGHAANLDLRQSARRNIRRIDQWIRSFLALSRDGICESEAMDLKELLEDVLMSLMQDPGRKVSFEIDLPDIGPTFQGIPAELKSIFLTIFHNALEASPKNGQIFVSLRELENEWCLEVQDQGGGLAEEVKDKLFAPHVTNKTYGSGMGLFLAQRMISTRYGGRIELENKDIGAVARLYFPKGPNS